ncbi:MAG: response regulator transcription factor [Armatimonadetes bacterium]|nr:response regulator transcription factor [Armatimonadota bacterium]
MEGKVLAADDDSAIVELLREALEADGLRVQAVLNGLQALQAVTAFKPDLIILDIVMPGMDGLELCQQIRRITLVPIFFLSGRAAERDRIAGLELGADRYITKPFSIHDLRAQVRATLRREQRYRGEPEPERSFRIGDTFINLPSRRVMKGQEEIGLTPTEFRLLTCLYENAGQIVSRDLLLEYLWGSEAEGIRSRTVDVAIGRLRRKIEADPKRPAYLKAVPGFGYRLDVEE